MKKILLSIGIVSLLFGGVFLFNQPITETTKVDKPVVIYTVPVRESPTRSELLRLTNIERAKVDVAPLIEDARLDQSAQIKSDDMVKNNYFGHVDSNGKHGYEYVPDVAPGLCKVAGENITDNIYKNDSKTAIRAFVNSPKHYEAMIDSKYTLTGFGISGTKVTVHFCQQI